MANENPLNIRLCDILVEHGIKAEALVKHGSSETDIECKIGDYTVAIEAEHGTSTAKKKEAIRDADLKLQRRVCDIAVALVYPEGYRTKASLERWASSCWPSWASSSTSTARIPSTPASC